MVNHEYKVVIAENPKVMSTTVKPILETLSGHPGNVRADSSLVKYLAGMPPEEVHNILDTYKRVVFLRHPFSRVYSAWKNKFVQNALVCRKSGCETGARMWVGKATEALTHAGMNVTGMSSVELLEALTWDRFVSAVLHGHISDRHWGWQASYGVRVAVDCRDRRTVARRPAAALPLFHAPPWAPALSQCARMRTLASPR